MTEDAPNAATDPASDAGTPDGPRSLLTHSLPARKAIPVPSEDATCPPIPPNAIRHGECGLWWTGAERAHASCCHRTFSGMSAFDAHRRGLRCNEPESVGLVARQKPFGTLWGWPAPDGGYGSVRRLKGDSDDHMEPPTVNGEVI